MDSRLLGVYTCTKSNTFSSQKCPAKKAHQLEDNFFVPRYTLEVMFDLVVLRMPIEDVTAVVPTSEDMLTAHD